jgi:hypothetical protein
MRTIETWDPAERPVHCSNCRNCIVSGDGILVPEIHCAKGHGEERSFWQVVRATRPSGFRAAAECPDFSLMDDDT